MNQQTQSLSPEALCFAIIDVMSNELTPLIQLLKKWRAANDLSQAEAVAAFQAERPASNLGYPAKLGNWTAGSARSLSRSSRGFFETTFKNFKTEDQMNMNLDDLEILLRNLMLSLGHASEMRPPRLSFVKAENARHINNAAAVLADLKTRPTVTYTR
jgi:hypothetical protein